MICWTGMLVGEMGTLQLFSFDHYYFFYILPAWLLPGSENIYHSYIRNLFVTLCIKKVIDFLFINLESDNSYLHVWLPWKERNLNFTIKIWKPDYSEEITYKIISTSIHFYNYHSVDKDKQCPSDAIDYNPKVTSYSP